MTELIHHLKQTNQFIMMTKYDYTLNSPFLVEISFAKKFPTYVILTEIRYLPDETIRLFQHIQLSLSIILRPVNLVCSRRDLTVLDKSSATHFSLF